MAAAVMFEHQTPASLAFQHRPVMFQGVSGLKLDGTLAGISVALWPLLDCPVWMVLQAWEMSSRRSLGYYVAGLWLGGQGSDGGQRDGTRGH